MTWLGRPDSMALYTDEAKRQMAQRFPFFRAFILSLLLAAVSGAQSDRPSLQQERPIGVQITNIPADQQRPGTEREQEGTDQKSSESPERRREGQHPAPELVRLPPEPDIEFQDYVASSLGYRLQIFGQNLFENVPSTFAPLDRVPVTPDYLIGPGDELLIRAWGQLDINYRVTVDRIGAVYLPKVGVISVAGLRYDQLTDYMRNAVARVFKNFDITVTLGQLRSIQVFVVGQARRPGSYTVSSLSTLVNALFVSGGPSKRGSMRRIQLKRQGKEITTFDLYDLIAHGDKSKDTQLLPGDVIYVPPVGRLAALAGSINIPGVFELKDHDTLADVVGYAGGLATTAAWQRAIVERIDDHHVQGCEHKRFPRLRLGQCALIARCARLRWMAHVRGRGSLEQAGIRIGSAAAGPVPGIFRSLLSQKALRRR
jgi:protein involved in polysaccharide export with SLBB domain